jgi:hypothetical protein
MEGLLFIWIIGVVIWELHLQPAFDVLLEPCVETFHVQFVAFYVGEVPFVQKKFADTADFLVVVPKFCSAFYPTPFRCTN